MTLTFLNVQRRYRLDTAALRRLALSLAARAQASALEREPWREVAVHLLDDASIAPVNATVLGHTGATDVITQRYQACPGEPAGLVGELFVNVERAVRAAARRPGWSPDRELALYLAHGLDHLAGADDQTPAARARMRRRELRWLRLTPAAALFRV